MQVKLSDFLPQGFQVEALLNELEKRNIPHALIICGDTGVGKRTLARLIATAILCENPGREGACGKCASCLQNENLAHPDFFHVQPGNPLVYSADKKGKNTIPIDDIREVIRICGKSTYQSTGRVFLIEQADKMTLQAQNGFLKILEEPPDGTCFLLTAEHVDVLLPTILSRCRMIRLNPWPDQIIERILQKKNISQDRIHEILTACNGSIGHAVSMADDEDYWSFRDQVYHDFFHLADRSSILQISGRLKDEKDQAGRTLDILDSRISIMLKDRLEGNIQHTADLPGNWIRFAEKAPLSDFSNLLGQIQKARVMLQSSVNYQAVIEQLLLSFVGEYSKWQT